MPLDLDEDKPLESLGGEWEVEEWVGGRTSGGEWEGVRGREEGEQRGTPTRRGVQNAAAAGQGMLCVVIVTWRLSDVFVCTKQELSTRAQKMHTQCYFDLC